MPNDEPVDGKCNAEVKNGTGYCASYPVKDDDGNVRNGRCRMHGGTSPGAPKGHEPWGGGDRGEGKAETHGMRSDPHKWFDRHREEVSDEVRTTVAAAVERSNVDYGDHMKMKNLVNAAINLEQIDKGNKYINEEGVIVDSIVSVSDGGIEHTNDEENPVFLAKSRLQKNALKILKDLGYLDDPDSQQAEATEEMAAAMKELANEYDGGADDDVIDVDATDVTHN